jgi:hypothetical protein
MIAPPMTAEEVEQARAKMSSEAQQIYDDTERAVKAEIGRLDAAQTWAEGEMDRITAAALKDLDDGKDPDAVQKQLDEDLKATIAKASDPAFDPRKLPMKAEPPAPAPAPAPASEPSTRSGCTTERSAQPSLALLVVLALLQRPRRVRAR